MSWRGEDEAAKQTWKEPHNEVEENLEERSILEVKWRKGFKEESVLTLLNAADRSVSQDDQTWASGFSDGRWGSWVQADCWLTPSVRTFLCKVDSIVHSAA